MIDGAGDGMTLRRSEDEGKTGQIAVLLLGLILLITLLGMQFVMQRNDASFFAVDTEGYAVLKDGLTLAVAVIGGWLLYQRTWNADRTRRLAEESRLTESFYKGSEMLGSDKGHVQSAGLTVLASCAITKPDRFYQPFLVVLRSYLFDNYKSIWSEWSEAVDVGEPFTLRTGNVSATHVEAMNYVGLIRGEVRRPWPPTLHPAYPGLYGIQGVILQKMTMEGCDFSHIFLTGVLRNVTFVRCDFRGTIFQIALNGHLSFIGCNLDGCSVKFQTFAHSSITDDSMVIRVEDSDVSNFMVNGTPFAAQMEPPG